MQNTGMFFLRVRKRKSTTHAPSYPFNTKKIFALLSVVAIVIGTGFVCRAVTLNSLHLKSKANVTLVSIMPEDNPKEPEILDAIQHDNVEFLNNNNDYLGYVMPVDYIMQGMIANTEGAFHLYKRHHTVGLIIDWVLHPFAHLRRSPFAQMAKSRHADPILARRHHCPLGIDNKDMDCNNCVYRRVIFVEVVDPSNHHMSGKALFGFGTRRIPVGFIDIDTKTGEVIDKKRVGSQTAWGDVPTPAI